MKECHIRDGVALIKFFSWLETELQKGTVLDEVDAANKLEDFRKLGDRFKGLSFDTISSTGANAAIIHYKPEKGACSTIDINSVYLCDSGAQYLDGTTDTTRTMHFGTPTETEKTAYTLVLKGMISLGNVVFPKGTSGFALDVLARQFLWAQGLDYRHGTGHGVGSFLVYFPPTKENKIKYAIEYHMLISVECPRGPNRHRRASAVRRSPARARHVHL